MKYAFITMFLLSALAAPADASWSKSALERRAEIMAKRYGVPGETLKAICERESSWNPLAVGRQGEIGLCQLRPETVLLMKGPNWRRDLSDSARIALVTRELYDPITNLEWAAKYLHWMIKEARGDVTLAIAAYNAGPGVIRYVNNVKDSMEAYTDTAYFPLADRAIARR